MCNSLGRRDPDPQGPGRHGSTQDSVHHHVAFALQLCSTPCRRSPIFPASPFPARSCDETPRSRRPARQGAGPPPASGGRARGAVARRPRPSSALKPGLGGPREEPATGGGLARALPSAPGWGEVSLSTDLRTERAPRACSPCAVGAAPAWRHLRPPDPWGCVRLSPRGIRRMPAAPEAGRRRESHSDRGGSRYGGTTGNSPS